MKSQIQSQDLKEYVESLATPEGWRVAYPILQRAGHAALDEVLEGLSHPNWRIRKWCVAFMDHYADARCVSALVRALDDPIADVRRHAVHSIGCQPCKQTPLTLDVIKLLIDRAMNDESIRVRRTATHMLGNQPQDDRAAKALWQIINKDSHPKLLSNAKWALKQHAK